ncbi:MAG TPA: hypothetical protein VGN98_11220, partial [Tianweitania sediminis]|nr:hypothetical protein [Tianweitania sediminis]
MALIYAPNIKTMSPWDDDVRPAYRRKLVLLGVPWQEDCLAPVPLTLPPEPARFRFRRQFRASRVGHGATGIICRNRVAMTFLPQSLRKILSFAVAAAATAFLSGCILVTDTSRMNPDVFVQETAPVFHVPPYADPPSNQPPPMPNGIPHRRQLYPTHFHQTYRQTYGMPVS